VVPLVLGLRLAVEEDMMMGGLIAPEARESFTAAVEMEGFFLAASARTSSCSQ